MAILLQDNVKLHNSKASKNAVDYLSWEKKYFWI